MSQLDQLSGKALRDRLNNSATERLVNQTRLQSESLLEQQQRLKDNQTRAATIAQEALTLQSKLEVQRENRIIQAERDSAARSRVHQDLQNSVQDTLEELAVERLVSSSKRATERAEARQNLSIQTQGILEEAAESRAELRANLEEFAAALRGQGSSRASGNNVVLPQNKRVTLTIAAAKPVAETLNTTTVGAMQNPEPMTAIQRRRENVLIKMIAANPNIRLIDLEQNLYLEASELRVLLNALKAKGRILELDGAFKLSAKVA